MSDLVAAPVGGAAADVTAVANGTGVADWIALLKPRVVSLVVVTGAIGMAVAPGRLNPVLAITTVIAIALGAGAAGAINMWYDRDIDRKMRRTATRPVAAGRVDPDEALHYGIGLSALSVLMLGLATNIAAGAWLALSIAFYVFVYTMWLKRRTPQNIVIGGAAGAFPPIIGWVAVTGHLALMPILLFSIVFLWTPPHFWALSLYACGDYDRAGVPMLPVVRGRRTTRWHVLIYTVPLVAVSLLPWCLGLAGPIYGLTAAILGAGFLALSTWVLLEPQDETGRSLRGERAARKTFRYSLFYLAVLFTSVLVDHLVF